MYPELTKEIQEDPWNAKIPEAETRLEMGVRIREGLQDLRRRYYGKSVLLVTHGGVFQRLTEYLNEVDVLVILNEFTNTCVFVLDFSGDVPVILKDCDACHLGDLKTADDGHLQV